MAEFLNNNVKYLRNIEGLSQQGLADKVGIDRSTISRIENNEIETTLDNAIKIANAFDVSLYSLVGRDLRGKDLHSIRFQHEEYKKLLKEKGLMDENEIINEEKLDELMKIADMMKNFNKKD